MEWLFVFCLLALVVGEAYIILRMATLMASLSDSLDEQGYKIDYESGKVVKKD